MLIANYSKEAVNDIYRIHDGSFPFPDFDDSTFISKKVIIDKGKIIGCGLTKLTSEFILILDRSASLKVRVNSLNSLQRNVIEELSKKGIKDTHIFVNEDSVAKYAEHMGFQRCPEKNTLSLRFGY
jgi:hypothetical protein